MSKLRNPRFRNHRFSTELVSHIAWLYFAFV
jgi:hypothetical protein